MHPAAARTGESSRRDSGHDAVCGQWIAESAGSRLVNSTKYTEQQDGDDVTSSKAALTCCTVSPGASRQLSLGNCQQVDVI